MYENLLKQLLEVEWYERVNAMDIASNNACLPFLLVRLLAAKKNLHEFFQFKDSLEGAPVTFQDDLITEETHLLSLSHELNVRKNNIPTDLLRHYTKRARFIINKRIEQLHLQTQNFLSDVIVSYIHNW